MTQDDNVIDAEEVELVATRNLPAVVDASKGERVKPAGWVEKPPPSPRRDAELFLHPENQCVGHKKNGERCRKYAIRGTTVCRTHGGATKHVRNRAEIRVQNASDRLMGKLIEFAFDDNKPPDTQLRAIRDALDRAGLQPKTSVEIGIAKPYETVFDSIGGTPSAESHSVSWGYDPAGLGRDVADVENAFPPAQPHTGTPTQPPAQAAPRNHGMTPDDSLGYEVLEGEVVQTEQQSSGDGPSRQASPRQCDRERDAQRPPHITGEAAIAAANAANSDRDSGAVDTSGVLKAIESGHKRYPHP